MKTTISIMVGPRAALADSRAGIDVTTDDERLDAAGLDAVLTAASYAAEQLAAALGIKPPAAPEPEVALADPSDDAMRLAADAARALVRHEDALRENLLDGSAAKHELLETVFMLKGAGVRA